LIFFAINTSLMHVFIRLKITGTKLFKKDWSKLYHI